MRVDRHKAFRAIILFIVVCYIATITILSVVKVSDVITVEPEYDSTLYVAFYLAHICFYFGLNTLLLLFYALGRRVDELLRWLPMVGISLLAVAYSILMEFVQAQVGRECSLSDIAANVVGALLSLILFRSPIVSYFIRKLQRKE